MENINLRLPNITAEDSKTQIKQLQNYIYQLVEQLNYALGDSKTSEAKNVPQGELQNVNGAISEVLSGDVEMHRLVLSSTTDIGGGKEPTDNALVIGDPDGAHIEFDGNEIMAKSDATTPSGLFINADGGATTFGGDANVRGNLQSNGVNVGSMKNYNSSTLAPAKSVPNNAWTDLLTVEIPNDGIWMISASAQFASNSTGYRGIRLVNNDGSAYGNVAYDYRQAVNGAVTTCAFCFPQRFSKGTYKLQAIHTRGSALSVTPRFYSVFLCS